MIQSLPRLLERNLVRRSWVHIVSTFLLSCFRFLFYIPLRFPQAVSFEYIPFCMFIAYASIPLNPTQSHFARLEFFRLGDESELREKERQGSTFYHSPFKRCSPPDQPYKHCTHSPEYSLGPPALLSRLNSVAMHLSRSLPFATSYRGANQILPLQKV